MPRKDISEYQFLTQLKSLPFVKMIYLYGSRAKGIQEERSDIDLAIDCPDANDEEWNKVLEIIENSDTLLVIDCVRYDQIKSEKLRKAILDDHIILYKRTEK